MLLIILHMAFFEAQEALSYGPYAGFHERHELSNMPWINEMVNELHALDHS